MRIYTRMTLLAIAMLCSSPAVFALGDYVIGEGDLLVISVWGEQQLGQTVRVRPDGKVTLLALGDVKAANLTPRELQAELAGKFKTIVRNPVVTVVVQEITNNKVYIFGSGASSGVFSLTQRTTLMQLLCQLGQAPAAAGGAGAAAGGTAPAPSIRSADLRNAFVLRRGKKIKEDFYNLFINGVMSEDVVIEPGDAVYIPAHAERNIYVVGAVNTPRAIAYRDGLTVMEAILEAGGFTRFAKQNDTMIYRGELAIPARMKDLVSEGNLKQNIRLRPGDYVVVKEGVF